MHRFDKSGYINAKKMFVDLVDQLKKVHDRGYIFGEISKDEIIKDENGNWQLIEKGNLHEQGCPLCPKNDYIGWKKQNRAPEYRNACLRGAIYYPTKTGDIYGLAYSIYEMILGTHPPLNFQLNRHWTNDLENAFGCDTEKKKAALQSLLNQCTQVSEYHRIQTCEQLEDTEEYHILFSGSE